MLTTTQLTALKAAINAETDPTFVAHRDIGNTEQMAVWLNGAGTTDAWLPAATRAQLFEATDVAKFDGLSAGKRDAWRLMMDNAPIDFGRNANRKAVLDIWGATDSVAVLQALREKATRAQEILGGTSKTTNTVTGLDRAYAGTLSYTDVIAALNS